MKTILNVPANFPQGPEPQNDKKTIKVLLFHLNI